MEDDDMFAVLDRHYELVMAQEHEKRFDSFAHTCQCCLLGLQERRAGSRFRLTGAKGDKYVFEVQPPDAFVLIAEVGSVFSGIDAKLVLPIGLILQGKYPGEYAREWSKHKINLLEMVQCAYRKAVREFESRGARRST